MPGFYDIYEYEVDRAVFVKNKLEKFWCHREHEGTVVLSHDIGRTVFFSENSARSKLVEIINQKQGESNGKM